MSKIKVKIFETKYHSVYKTLMDRNCFVEFPYCLHESDSLATTLALFAVVATFEHLLIVMHPEM